MMTSTKRHIPSRFITYHFVCRNCGDSGVGDFDKFKEPKKRMDILCSKCKNEVEIEVEDIYGWDQDELF